MFKMKFIQDQDFKKSAKDRLRLAIIFVVLGIAVLFIPKNFGVIAAIGFLFLLVGFCTSLALVVISFVGMFRAKDPFLFNYFLGGVVLSYVTYQFFAKIVPGA